MRNAAAERVPLRGTLRVIVVLVDFSDKPMTQTAEPLQRPVLLARACMPTKSVREYYQEVTNGLVDIQGDVVGPFRMPQTLAAYAHGASGLGGALPERPDHGARRRRRPPTRRSTSARTTTTATASSTPSS